MFNWPGVQVFTFHVTHVAHLPKHRFDPPKHTNTATCGSMPIKKFKCSPTIGGSDEYTKLEFVRSLETWLKESEVKKAWSHLLAVYKGFFGRFFAKFVTPPPPKKKKRPQIPRMFLFIFWYFSLTLDNNKSQIRPSRKGGIKCPNAIILEKKRKHTVRYFLSFCWHNSTMKRAFFSLENCDVFFSLHFPSCQLHHCQLHSKGGEASTAHIHHQPHQQPSPNSSYIGPNITCVTVVEPPGKDSTSRSSVRTLNPKLSCGLLRPSASFCVGPAKSPSGVP